MKKLFIITICCILMLGLTGCTNSSLTHQHTWQDATCIEPKTCSECGETEGEPLGHTVHLGICSRCGKAVHEEVMLNIVQYNSNIQTIHDNVSNYIKNVNYNNLQDCFNKYNAAYNELIKAKEEINKIIIESEDFEELNTLRELAQKVIDHIPSKIENSTSEKLIDFLNEYKTYLISLSDYYKEVTNVLSLFNK